MTVSAILFGRKNSKGIKNKNIKKICGTPLYLHSLKEAFKIEQIKNIYISSDDERILKGGKKLGCKILNRPKKLATDRALLSDAMQDAVSKVIKLEPKLKYVIFLLCNSPCFTSEELKMGIKIIKTKKKIETVTTISKLNMFSPVRAKKIKAKKLYNFIENKTLIKYTALSGDRDQSTDCYFCTNAFSVSKINILKNMSKNPWPFKWMGKNVEYIMQRDSLGDIDFEWQLPAVEWWIKKYKLKR